MTTIKIGNNIKRVEGGRQEEERGQSEEMHRKARRREKGEKGKTKENCDGNEEKSTKSIIV